MLEVTPQESEKTKTEEQEQKPGNEDAPVTQKQRRTNAFEKRRSTFPFFRQNAAKKSPAKPEEEADRVESVVLSDSSSCYLRRTTTLKVEDASRSAGEEASFEFSSADRGKGEGSGRVTQQDEAVKMRAAGESSKDDSGSDEFSPLVSTGNSKKNEDDEFSPMLGSTPQGRADNFSVESSVYSPDTTNSISSSSPSRSPAEKPALSSRICSAGKARGKKSKQKSSVRGAESASKKSVTKSLTKNRSSGRKTQSAKRSVDTTVAAASLDATATSGILFRSHSHTSSSSARASSDAVKTAKSAADDSLIIPSMLSFDVEEEPSVQAESAVPASDGNADPGADPVAPNATTAENASPPGGVGTDAAVTEQRKESMASTSAETLASLYIEQSSSASSITLVSPTFQQPPELFQHAEEARSSSAALPVSDEDADAFPGDSEMRPRKFDKYSFRRCKTTIEKPSKHAGDVPGIISRKSNIVPRRSLGETWDENFNFPMCSRVSKDDQLPECTEGFNFLPADNMKSVSISFLDARGSMQSTAPLSARSRRPSYISRKTTIPRRSCGAEGTKLEKVSSITNIFAREHARRSDLGALKRPSRRPSLRSSAEDLGAPEAEMPDVPKHGGDVCDEIWSDKAQSLSDVRLSGSSADSKRLSPTLGSVQEVVNRASVACEADRVSQEKSMASAGDHGFNCEAWGVSNMLEISDASERSGSAYDCDASDWTDNGSLPSRRAVGTRENKGRQNVLPGDAEQSDDNASKREDESSEMDSDWVFKRLTELVIFIKKDG